MEPDLLETEQTQDFNYLLESLNEKLRAAGAGSAEIAFGMGFGMGMLPALIIIGLLFVFKLINLILAFILIVMALLALVGVGMLIALQARRNAMQRVYQATVEPEVDRYLAQTGLTRERFDLLASQHLPADAPLQTFLKPPVDAALLDSADAP